MKQNTLHIVTIGLNTAWYLVDAPSNDEAFNLAEAARGAAGLPGDSRCIPVTAQIADRAFGSLVDKPFLGKLAYVPPAYHIEGMDRVCDTTGRILADCADNSTAELILQALLAYNKEP